MPRALLIVLDSVGVGGAQDAGLYGDEGSDTLGHIAEACARGSGDRADLRSGPLKLPNLAALGLGQVCRASTGKELPSLMSADQTTGLWGYGVETSRGKDTPSGHWEIAGAPVEFDWGYFPLASPTFPPDLTTALIEKAGLTGILGDCHASGTDIIEQFGAQHVKTLQPICYTSVDSVLQIAAHETAFGLQRLYEVCAVARRLCDPLNIGRVIARPFLGDASQGFYRTGNRKDFAIPPHSKTIFDCLAENNRQVISVGKIGDIFAHRNTGLEVKAFGNEAMLTATLQAFSILAPGGFMMVNLVDFDTEYGHRRDVPGYAAALEAFDARLPEIRHALREDDLLIITADHGNDPTWRGTDHTREHVPILGVLNRVRQPIGRRETMADITASICAQLNISWQGPGISFVNP